MKYNVLFFPDYNSYKRTLSNDDVFLMSSFVSRDFQTNNPCLDSFLAFYILIGGGSSVLKNADFKWDCLRNFLQAMRIMVVQFFLFDDTNFNGSSFSHIWGVNRGRSEQFEYLPRGVYLTKQNKTFFYSNKSFDTNSISLRCINIHQASIHDMLLKKHFYFTQMFVILSWLYPVHIQRVSRPHQLYLNQI